MYLNSAQLFQLAGALLAGIFIFVAAYAAPLRIAAAILLIMIPFQPVATSYGTANTIMTYVIAGALIVNGRLKYLPIMAGVLAVVFAYLISISQLPRSLYTLHGIEVISLVAAFLVFIIAYNMARETPDLQGEWQQGEPDDAQNQGRRHAQDRGQDIGEDEQRGAGQGTEDCVPTQCPLEKGFGWSFHV